MTDTRALTVIDFSHVSMIDLSCADEVVAKLLLRYGAENSVQEAYFLFRGVTEDHHDAIEAVLEPAVTPYLFFVAAKDGQRHVFSRTWAEHQAAIDALAASGAVAPAPHNPP